MKLLYIETAHNPKKKWRAVFDTGKHTEFGDSSYQDYTQHKDKDRRTLYRARHKKDLNTNDPTRAGFLAYHLLWGNSTSLETNIRAYNRLLQTFSQE